MRIQQLITALTLSTVLCTSVYAADVGSIGVTTNVRATQEGRSQESLASEWGLDVDEWKRYQEVMQGPRGVFSPGLDPISALGIEARSDQERLRYARLQAQMETQRVEKELAYQRAYDEAIAEAVAGQNVVNLPREKPLFAAAEQKAKNTGSGRLALFVSSDCAHCGSKVKELQGADESFDIYLVGSAGDDNQVRKWAVAAGVDPAKVRQRQITLNHDEGRWSALQAANDVPADTAFPFALRMDKGRWVKE